MSQERSEAVVIRGVDFSETSRIMTFLSPSRGRLACLAQGAKRPGNRIGGLLDTFNRLEIVYYWKDNRGVQKLGEASLIDSYTGIKSDLDKSAYAAFALELAYKTAQENDPSHDLYAALVRGLDGMAAWQGDARTHAVWQILLLVQAAGFGLDLNGHAPDTPILFSYEAGVVEAGEPYDLRLPTEAARELRRLATAETCVTADHAGLLFKALRGYVIRHWDADFRSLRLIDRILPPSPA